jgi:hypothetical protein
MDSFIKIIQEWQVFYETVALASATLTGLIFVAFTLNSEILNQEMNKFQLRIARKSFGDLLSVLTISLLFLVPRLPSVGLAIGLLSNGSAWLIGIVRLLIRSIKELLPGSSAWYLIKTLGLSFMGCLGLIGVAIALIFGHTGALYWLVAVLAILLASVSTTAWSLLTAIPSGKH